MRFNFKKIASAASSALMIGSTVALAAAANYPAPFVSGSTSDVAIVVGQGAATTDFTAANSISSDLSTVFAANGGSSNSTVDLSSVENIKLFRDGDKLNLGNTATTIYGTSTLTSADLPMTLGDGTYTNDANSDYDYEQRIALGSAGAGLQLNYFQSSDYKDRAPSVGVNLTSNYVVLNYTLDFTTDAQSAVSSSGHFSDLETTTIKILGKDYYISSATNGSNIKMTLLDAANTGIVSEGETTTLNVEGTTYTIGLNFVSSTEAKLDVNGQVTNSLSEGETFKLSDGSYVGVKDILYNSKDTGVSKVEFSVGKGKIELTSGSNVKINDDTINQITAEIPAVSYSGANAMLDRINLVWTTDDTEFITPESSLVMPELKAVALSMPNFMMKSDAEMTQVTSGGSDYVQLETMVKDGSVTIPLLFGSTSTGNLTGIGKSSSEMLRTTNNTVLPFNYTAGDRYFVASWNSSNEGQSYYMKAYQFKTEDGVNKTTLAKYADGTWSDICDSKRPGDTCNVGSLTLTLATVTNNGGEKFANFSISSGGSFNTLYTKSGLKVFLPWSGTAGTASSQALGFVNFTNLTATSTSHNYDSVDLTFWTEDKNDAVALGSQFNVTVNNNGNNEFETSALTLGRSTFTDPDDSNHIMGMVYADAPALVERFGQSSDQRHSEISYYGGEAYGDLRLSAYIPASQSSSGGALGDIVVTADKVATVGSKNLIVVGGSCINTVAADLLGSTTPICGADFTQKTGVGAGSFLIQSFSSKWSSGKVALLVAGYNAEDTVNAARALTSQKPDTMAGKKYTGSTATSLSPVTT